MRLDEKNLAQALARLSAAALLLTPQMVEGVSRFAPYQAGGELFLTAGCTLLPLKEVLLPQTEMLYSCHENTAGLAITEQRPEIQQIVFGARPCDVHGIDRLDKVFLQNGPADSFYARKRALLTVIAVTCATAAPTCFCDSMGVDPNQAPLADVELHPLPGGWRVAAHTDKGRQVQTMWQGLLAPLKDEEPGAPCACALRVDSSGLAEKLPRLFAHPLWQDLAQPCLSCGICTYLCPACHCYDLNAESRGRRGAQFRSWDSCMFPEYTAMAGGHNPRPEASQRLRNRFLHKLAYFPQRYGLTLCAGCGRCLQKCPAHIHITELMAIARGVEP